MSNTKIFLDDVVDMYMQRNNINDRLDAYAAVIDRPEDVETEVKRCERIVSLMYVIKKNKKSK